MVWETFWKLCVITRTRCKCGTSIEGVEEIRSLIQSESNWITPPGEAFPRGALTASAYSVDWKKQFVGAVVNVDFVQSSGLVLGSFCLLRHRKWISEAFGAVSGWLCEQCLDSLVCQGEDSSLTYLLTAGCATYVGITGQRLGGRGLGGGSIRLMEHIRDTSEVMRSIMQGVALESVAVKNVPLVKAMTAN